MPHLGRFIICLDRRPGFRNWDRQRFDRRADLIAGGHTATNPPDLFRTPKLTVAGPGQYWGGGPPGKPFGCCQLFAFRGFAHLKKFRFLLKKSPLILFTVTESHVCHRSHFGSRYHIWLMRIAGLFLRFRGLSVHLPQSGPLRPFRPDHGPDEIFILAYILFFWPLFVGGEI